jgi:hypothetical protein
MRETGNAHNALSNAQCCDVGIAFKWDAGLDERGVKLPRPKLETIIASIYSWIHSLNLLVGKLLIHLSLVNPWK